MVKRVLGLNLEVELLDHRLYISVIKFFISCVHLAHHMSYSFFSSFLDV